MSKVEKQPKVEKKAKTVKKVTDGTIKCTSCGYSIARDIAYTLTPPAKFADDKDLLYCPNCILSKLG